MHRRRPWPLLLPLALLNLAGCSGTPFGDQLSRSFSQPQAAPARATKPATASPTADGTKPAAAPPVTAPVPAPARKPVSAAAPLTPAPYRVTIKLPAADPSSPAEAVTDALRAAGVAFEVETIERVPAAADSGLAPVRSPAPPAR
jgi:hypothetical protein